MAEGSNPPYTCPEVSITSVTMWKLQPIVQITIETPWREHLFVAMQRNARDAADYGQIPTNRVIEAGTQVEI